MKKIEENTQKVFKAVADLCDANPTITSTIPAMGETVTSLKNVWSEIDEHNRLFTTSDDGVTANKNSLEEILETSIINVSKKARVYGRRNNMAALLAVVKFTDREIYRLRDQQLIDKGESVYNAIEPLATPLVPFGVTATDIPGLRTSIDNYKAGISGQGTGIDKRIGARRTLKEIFAEGMELLKEELDGFVETLHGDYPEFYNQYQAARKIRGTGGGNGSAGETPEPPSPTPQS